MLSVCSVLLSVSLPTSAQLSGSSCLGANGGNSCSAGDLNFSGVNVTQIIDGCVNLQDTAVVNLEGTVTSGSSQRFDVGIWISEDGSDALTGSACFRDFLPVSDGFTDFEGNKADACGSVATNTSTVREMFGVTLPCADLDGDTLAEVSTCLSWKNVASNDCADLTGAVPGTGSKCRCEIVDIDGLPIPNLSLEKTCTPDSISPGETVACTITISNAANAGTATNLFFVDDYPETYGSITDVVPSGTTTTSDNGSELRIETGDIAPGQTITIDYNFNTFDADSLPNGAALDTFTNVVDTFYVNDQGQVINQNVSATDTTTVPVELSFVRFENRQNGKGLVSWQTYEEVGNLGFNIFMKDPEGGALYPLNNELIASKVVNSLNVTDYQFSLDVPLDEAEYYLQDIDVFGNTELNGPYYLGASKGEPVKLQAKIDWPRIKQAKKLRESATRRNKGGKSGNGDSTSAESGPAILAAVTASGLQRIYLSEIQAVSPDLVLKSNKLSVANSGVAVPVYHGADSVGAYIEFFGEPSTTLYSDTNYYRISAANGAEMRTVKSDRGGEPLNTILKTVSVGEQKVYSSFIQGEDPWYDHQLFARSGPDSKRYLLLTSDLVTVGAENFDALVEIDVSGGIDFPEDNDHDLVVKLNGNVIAHEIFDGVGSRTISASVSPELLEANQANEIDVILTGNTPRQIDLVQINKVQLSYPANVSQYSYQVIETDRALEFDQAALVYAQVGDQAMVRLVDEPKHNAKFRYFLRSDADARVTYHVMTNNAVHSPVLQLNDSQQVDLTPANHLVIAHPDFIGADLEAYVIERQSIVGGEHRIVSTHDIYARYSDYELDAQAIREFVRLTASFGALESILLVGADSYDYLDYLGLGAESFVPSLYARTSSLVSRAPSDALIADVDGDRMPDFAIGRLSVRTPEELAMQLTKARTFLTSGATGTQTALLVSDAKDQRNNLDFEAQNQDFSTALQATGWSATTLASGEQQSPVSVKQELIAAINSDQLDLLVYNGHSSQFAWSADRLLHLSDGSLIANQKPFVSIQWGCWNTYFSSPYRNTLADTFMRARGGAVAVLGSSTLSVFAEQDDFKPIFNRYLLQGRRLGDALTEAKQEYGRLYSNRPSVVLGLNMLGDPLLTP